MVSAINNRWAVDTEFYMNSNGIPEPVCIVAKNLDKGTVTKKWLGRYSPQPAPDLPFGRNDLLICYYAIAELKILKQIGQEFKGYVLDLYAEFCNETAGLHLPYGKGLLGACAYFDIPAMASSNKESMRQLVLNLKNKNSGNNDERILDYCEEDVLATEALYNAMQSRINLPQAFIRGQYCKALAGSELLGIPVDYSKWCSLRLHWPFIKERVIGRIDRYYGVYENSVFKRDYWVQLCDKFGYDYPVLESGMPELSREALKDMSLRYPHIAPIAALRKAFGPVKPESLPVYRDNRNRFSSSVFGTKTGRNAPRSSESILAKPKFMRNLIRPLAGCAIANIDYDQQEFGTAAALSKDANMCKAYDVYGDSYLGFAKLAGAVPMDATKSDYPVVRQQYKICALAIQYGMGAEQLAKLLGKPLIYGEYLLNQHKRLFRKYWEFSDVSVYSAMVRSKLVSPLGWQLRCDLTEIKETTARNFLIQATGGDILRIACIKLYDEGIPICATHHDSILIEAPIAGIEEMTQRAQQIMSDASSYVLNGFRLRTEAEIIKYPDHYHENASSKEDETMLQIWEIVERFINE